MTRTIKRLLSLAAAGAAMQFALLVAQPAGAVVLNISDANCEKWELGLPSGTPPTQLLTCVALAAPVCQLSGPGSGVMGNNITLTATCSPGPITGYQWTGGNCAGGTGSTCVSTWNSPGNVTYTVAATNASVPTPGAPASKTVTWGNTPVAVAPSNCTLTPDKIPTTVGEQVTLQARCTAGDPVDSWYWTGPNVTDPKTASASQNVIIAAATSDFTVQAENGGGRGPVVTLRVSVSGNPPPGGTNIGSCGPNFTATKVIDATIPANGVNVRYYTNVAGTFRSGAATGFGATEAIVVQFTAPQFDPYFSIGMYETGTPVTGSPSYRTMTLSTKPCDFNVPAGPDGIWAAEDTRLSVNLSAGGVSPYARYNLTAGATYYINVMNFAFGNARQCTADRCDVFFSFSNPKP